MDKIKKGLGRGLSSLIGETKVEPVVGRMPHEAPEGEVQTEPPAEEPVEEPNNETNS